jgi:hypothetical protein
MHQSANKKNEAYDYVCDDNFSYGYAPGFRIRETRDFTWSLQTSFRTPYSLGSKGLHKTPGNFIFLCRTIDFHHVCTMKLIFLSDVAPCVHHGSLCSNSAVAHTKSEAQRESGRPETLPESPVLPAKIPDPCIVSEAHEP